MSRVSAAFLAFGIMTVGVVFAARVAADSIPPPPTCPAHEIAALRGESRHGGMHCVPRPCTRDAQCGGSATCVARQVCRVTEQTWVSSPGPCRDQDGDGQCDGRRQVSRTYEVGACDARGQCERGSCDTLRECSSGRSRTEALGR
ncbi:hypothetical protein DB32_001053 [Sandaracinus amylolyticus]|uniref:Uncharacterized protein n=1 Tax=Sandaracinus amylolyticus TaxID=927083 RepID=A0A0F6SDR5_9BACT|nr:hypothetical protein DB32_001053 [Sandaracinus amylolyticus]